MDAPSPSAVAPPAPAELPEDASADGKTIPGPEVANAVADHYDRKPELGRGAREASKIIRLRSYNNWLKATLLQVHLFEGARVLDIGVGKGGDLTKYSLAGIAELVGAGPHSARSSPRLVSRTGRCVICFYCPGSGTPCVSPRPQISRSIPRGGLFPGTERAGLNQSRRA